MTVNSDSEPALNKSSLYTPPLKEVMRYESTIALIYGGALERKSVQDRHRMSSFTVLPNWTERLQISTQLGTTSLFVFVFVFSIIFYCQVCTDELKGQGRTSFSILTVTWSLSDMGLLIVSQLPASVLYTCLPNKHLSDRTISPRFIS